MDQYLATIMLWAGTWAPDGWVFCNGQLLSVQNYQALFSLLGKIYGGDGVNNFGVPNLCGRVAVGSGVLSGTNSIYQVGQQGGAEGVTLLTSQMPIHNHPGSGTMGGTGTATLPNITASASLGVSAQSGTTNTPSSTNVPASVPGIQINATTTKAVNAYGAADGTTKWNVPVAAGYAGGNNVSMQVGGNVSVQVGNNGGSLPHENRQPYSVVNYIICVNGLYPPRP